MENFVQEKFSVETFCTGKVECGNILYRKRLAWKHLVQETFGGEAFCTGKRLAWKHFVQENV